MGQAEPTRSNDLAGRGGDHLHVHAVSALMCGAVVPAVAETVAPSEGAVQQGAHDVHNAHAANDAVHRCLLSGHQ